MFGVDLPFELILIGIICLMLMPAVRSLMEGIIEWLVKATKIEILGFKINVVGPLTTLVQAVSHYIGELYATVSAYPVNLLTAFTRYFDFITKSTFAAAWELQRFAQWMVAVALPDTIAAARAGLGKSVHDVTKIVKTLPGQIITTIPKAIRNDIGAIQWLADHLKAIERAIARSGSAAVSLPIAAAERLLLPIEARIAALTKKLTWIQKIGLTGAAAATVALGIERLGLNWIKCENNRTVGRAICGLPAKALEGLLSLLTDALAFSAVCELLPLMEKGLELVEPGIVDLTTGAAAILCRGKYTEAKALAVPALRLPALPTGVPTLQLP